MTAQEKAAFHEVLIGDLKSRFLAVLHHGFSVDGVVSHRREGNALNVLASTDLASIDLAPVYQMAADALKNLEENFCAD